MSVWKVSAVSLFLVACFAGCSNDSPAPPSGGASVPASPSGSAPAPAGSASAADVTSPTWTQVTSQDNRVSVSMPAPPVPAQQTAQGKDGPIHFTFYKAQSGGAFFNLTLTTFTEAALQNAGGGRKVLEGLAASLLVAKPGSTQELLRDLPDEGRPAIEFKYRFPAGTTAGGASYPSGYSVQRLRLLGNQVVWQFVDVYDNYAAANQAKVDQEISQFFDSLTIDGEAPPTG